MEPEDKRDRTSRASGKKKEHPTREQRRPRTPPRGRYPTYTILTATASDILEEIGQTDLLPKVPQRPKKPGRQVDTSKFCRYHKDVGHTTDECILLKDEIENLIQRGRLPSRYIRRDDRNRGREDHEKREVKRPRTDTERRRPPNTPPKEGRPTGVIHVIAGGIDKKDEDRPHKRRKINRSVMHLEYTEPRRKDSWMEPITFTDDELWDVDATYDDPMVITAMIANFTVERILIDQGSSADIMFKGCFDKLGIPLLEMKPYHGNLIGFTGDQVPALGRVKLRLTMGESPKTTSLNVNFLVVDAPSAYNALLGRPSLNEAKAVVSTAHLRMKFPTPWGVGQVKADQRTARQCYATSLGALKSVQEKQEEKTAKPEVMNCEIEDFRDEIERGRPTPTGELEAVELIPDTGKTVQINAQLDEETKQHLIALLKDSVDIFAWCPADMPGIDPDIICHSLNTDGRPGVIQKKRLFGAERQEAIKDEVGKLLAAGFIRETKYPDWLSNVVLVKKANNKWRMCVDFTDLNKACPKDHYPLPNIDKLVDGTCGHEVMSFLDAFSGYNQIRMDPRDAEKTSFITELGTFCYTVMPFGLKNAGATYQRMMDMFFKESIGKNLEVYVDDMVVKTKAGKSHIKDLEDIFQQLRRYQMKLNPNKCAFGVNGGKFLGFILTHRGIEANPEQCQAILDMKPPQTIKEVQRLNGRVAALHRFLAR